MNYKEKTNKLFGQFVKTSYGFKAHFWGILLPLFITITCEVIFTLAWGTYIEEPNQMCLAYSVAFCICGVVAACTLCIGNMLFGLMFKEYADTIEKNK